MADSTKKPPPAGDAPPPSSGAGFQFGDDQVESSWFRRAVSAGLRYTKARSERSGVKILPVLDLDADDGAPSFNPQLAAPKGQAKTPAKPAASTPPKKAPKPLVGAEDAPPTGAFGPPEKTLFKTAINQFLDYQAQKRVVSSVKQVRMMQSATMVGDEDGGVKRVVVRLAILAIAGGAAFVAFRVVTNRFNNAARSAKHLNQNALESELQETETVIKPKSRPAKAKSQKAP